MLCTIHTVLATHYTFTSDDNREVTVKMDFSASEIFVTADDNTGQHHSERTVDFLPSRHCVICDCGMYFGIHGNVNIICRGFGITNGELNDAHTIVLAITSSHILSHCPILACSQLILCYAPPYIHTVLATHYTFTSAFRTAGTAQ